MNQQFIKVIVLSIILGSLSGIFSGAIVYTHLFSYMDIGEVMIGAKDSTILPQTRLIDKETQKSVLSSFVTFYRVKTEGELVTDNIYLESDKFGYGFVITSDGWVVTDESVLPRDLKRVVALVGDKGVYSIKKIERDEKSNKVFVRLEATNLNPIAFGDSHALMQGESLYVFNNLGKVNKVSFSGLKYGDIENKNNIFNSSESLNKKIFFDGDLDNLAGAPLVNYRGEVVGVVSSEKNSAEPFQYVFWSMQNLFRNGEVAKLFLGVNYIDLSYVKSLDTSLSKRGALISSGGGRVGVIKHSPAWYAEIKEGDIILKVGKDELNEDYSLSERISEYRGGDKIELTILRGEEEQEVEVELIELK